MRIDKYNRIHYNNSHILGVVMKEEKYTLSEKRKMMSDFGFVDHEEFPYKIYMGQLQFNVMQECYRDQRVSYFQMAPLVKKTVPLEEADYILYAHPFARIEDFTDDALEDMERLNKSRKPGAEIIVMGKATNLKPLIDEKYENITYVPSHYADYIGKRFGIDITDKYVVYDDELNQLNIWPVDGCLNQCGFCRRTFMHIPFESQPLEFIKEQLDWFRKHHPEQMKRVSLRAENLTEYGLDIYGKSMLHNIIALLDTYDEIKQIDIPIGLCIGEITDELLKALCQTKKIKKIALNLEAGSNRLLQLIGKKHTKERAIEVCNALYETHPDIFMQTTVMIGLPTEGLEDILELSDLIIKCKVRYVHCNTYGYSPKHPIASLPQVSRQLRDAHLSYLIKLLKKNYDNEYVLEMRYEKIDDTSKRKVNRQLERLKQMQEYSLPRLLRVAYAYFVGDDIVVIDNTGKRHREYDVFKKELKRVVEARIATNEGEYKNRR